MHYILYERLPVSVTLTHGRMMSFAQYFPGYKYLYIALNKYCEIHFITVTYNVKVRCILRLEL